MANPSGPAGEAAKKKEEAEAAKRQDAELDKALADSFSGKRSAGPCHQRDHVQSETG